MLNQNLYGHQAHKVPDGVVTAGIHVSVTRLTTVRVGDESREVNSIFDFAQLVKMMDAEFAEEIKEAQRRPGFYEIKGNGRVEYRSLPQSVNIIRVACFLEKNVSRIHGSW